MAEQSAQEEPSMEEILASIRRIISEDGEDEAVADNADAAAGPVAVDTPAPEPEPESEPEPVADTPEAEEEAVAAAADDDFDSVSVEPDVAPEPAPEPATAPEPELAAAPEVVPEDDGDDVLDLTQEVPETQPGEPIVSHMTEAATSEHLKALSGLMVRNYPGSENTLEGVVREMLKPMLREWLDANLPTLVEQMVNREIARIAGRDK